MQPGDVLAVCLLCWSCGVRVAAAVHRTDLFPYGTLSGDSVLAEGDDETSRVLSLPRPFYFYSSLFAQLYVATNGIISAQDLPMEKQYVDDGFPTDFPVVAPFLADIDTSGGRGQIYYRVTETPSVLNRVAQEVHRGFPDAKFTPTHAVVATWENVAAYEEQSRTSGPSNKVRRVNTFQAVIGYDETDSYVLFLYPEGGLNFFGTRPKESYNVEIELPARVGFSRGEITYLIFSRTEGPHFSVTGDQETVKNLNHCGLSLLSIPYSRFQQQCSQNSFCSDYATGYCCHCRPGFYGNGRHCLPEGAPQRVSGKVSGTVTVGSTPVSLNNIDLHAYIVVGDGRAYTAISEVPEPVGWALMPVAPIGELFGWLFALELPNSQAGFKTTGAEFTRRAEITFYPGNERLSISQTARGLDDNNHLTVDTVVSGSVPFLPPGAEVTMDPFKETYQYYPSVATSSSVREFSVVSAERGSESFSFQLKQNITYRDCRHDNRAAAPETLQITMERVFVMYVKEERILRYAITNKISPVGVEPTGPELVNPCYAGNHDCDTTAQCIPLEGQAFQCQCATGYRGDGRNCYEQEGESQRPKTHCEHHRRRATDSEGNPIVGAYVPQCDSEGQYIPLQCYGETTYCWCVDQDGREVPGTRSHDVVKPACLPSVAPPTMRPLPRPDVTPPTNAGVTLLYAQGQKIGALPLNGTRLDGTGSKTLLTLHGSIVVGIGYDCKENQVYWTDLSARTINRASLVPGAEPEILINTNLVSPEGLAVDVKRRLIFWVDSTPDVIESANLDGSGRQTLFDTDLVNPRAIIVVSSAGTLYWTDWNREAPKIECASVDGQNRRVVVSDGIGLPNALTFDSSSGQVCWADAGTKRLECISPDGSGRRVIHPTLNYPFSMVYYRGHFYYTDWRSKDSSQFTDEYLPDQRSHLYGIAIATTDCLSGETGVRLELRRFKAQSTKWFPKRRIILKVAPLCAV
uniref:Nidogen 2a (osteonidogen) n=1 Tax=Scophthalmus maximus TaxID=52904 RepID=A0A8D3DJ30_SCOMX